VREADTQITREKYTHVERAHKLQTEKEKEREREREREMEREEEKKKKDRKIER